VVGARRACSYGDATTGRTTHALAECAATALGAVHTDTDGPCSLDSHYRRRLQRGPEAATTTIAGINRTRSPRQRSL
jgi:hypothetical protein